MGGTILAVAVLAALAAGLANLCVTHLRLSNRADNGMQASNLARSAIAAGIARVAETQDFGQERAETDTIEVENRHGRAILTFSQLTAQNENISYCTNNIGRSTAADGAAGASIPADTVHLVARGTSHGVSRTVEAVISVPSFPWAVAATGKVEVVEGATVGALPAGVWPPTDAQLEPADLVSNATVPDAVVLNGTSHILGNVETPGGVVINGEGVVIDGEVREGADPEDIPSLSTESLDPQVSGQGFDNLDTYSDGAPLDPTAPSPGDDGPPPTTGASGQLQLTGTARRSGSLTLSSGLKLDAAKLYVEGDLVVNGSVEGFGLLVVSGDVTITHGLNVVGATQIAVISGGRVIVQGNGMSSSSLKGMFYAHDGVEARKITVLGAVIAGGEDAGVTLDEARVLYQEQTDQVVELPTYIDIGISMPIENYLDDGEDGFGRNGLIVIPPIELPLPDPVVTGGGTANFSAPSSFIPLRERMKVVSWFEN